MPAKLNRLVTVIVEVPELPAVMENVVGLAEIEKSGGGTMTDIVTVFVNS